MGSSTVTWRARAVQREHLGRRMIGALLARSRVVHAAHVGGEPDPALVVPHAVMVVGLGVPDLLVAPIGRGLQRLGGRGVSGSERFRRVGIAHRRLEVRNLVGLGIEDRIVVGRVFGRADQRTVGIDGRMAPIRCDQVVQVFLGVAPVPGGDHDVALDAFRPRRLGLRQLALGDAVGPFAVMLERRAAEASGQLVGHHLAGLTRLHAAHPGLFAGLEFTQRRRDRAGGSWPSWWQPMQPMFLTCLSQSACVILSGMPLLPSNWPCPGSSASNTSRSPDSIGRPPPRSAPAPRGD